MRILIVFFMLSICFNLYNIDKPKLSSGIRGYSYFDEKDKLDFIYPSNLKDNIYLSYEEKFCDYFKFKHRFDFIYSNYNKLNYDLNNLRSYILKNTFYLFFLINKNNSVTLTSKPMFYYQYGENYIKLMNKLEYNLALKNFRFNIFYSHQYSSKENSLFYHNICFAFYWQFPRFDFIKYKTSFSIYFQHYTIENDIKITPIKSAVFNFEIVIDFNKLNFDEIFEKKEDEDEFFENE